MLKTEDFKFIEKEPSGWYWFSVSGESRQTINETVREQGFITVTEVGYNKEENQLGVVKQYICSQSCEFYENNEVLELIKELI